MLKVTNYAVSIDGTTIAVLDDNKLGFTLKGRSYLIRRTGFPAPVFALLRDGELLASIQDTPFVARYTLTCAGREWTLKSERWTRKSFGLFDGDVRVGGITPANTIHYARDIAIDLPEDVPLEAQVFLMWLLLWKWGAS